MGIDVSDLVKKGEGLIVMMGILNESVCVSQVGLIVHFNYKFIMPHNIDLKSSICQPHRQIN